MKGDIKIAGKWGDPRAQARRANDDAKWDLERRVGALEAQPHEGTAQTHGLTEADRARMRAQLSSMNPAVVSATGRSRIDSMLEGFLPPGATLSPGAGGSVRASLQKAKDLRRTGSNVGFPTSTNPSDSYHTTQRPYLPEFDSPDRQSYPVNRNLANTYWRLFYKTDPIVGTGIDMIGEMIWSNFELTGEGVDGEIRDALERMCEETQVRALLPYLSKEYLVMGEVIPHCYFDESEGIWTYIALHNPDQIEVIHSPVIRMPPILRFKPDHRMRQVMTSQHPMINQLRESMPPELMNSFMSGQPIELNTAVSATFIPRKLQPYDVRGTSLLSRLWRISMLEDAFFTADIATARRSGAPLKVAKLGDPATGWIPDPSQERKLHELLAEAENDPAAWLCWNYGLQFELVGVDGRVIGVTKNWDLIERIKLIALGISKGLLIGEITYAAAASGLTVFLQRLKALREFFEAAWIYPRFFRPISEMNAWIKPTEAELSHRVRTRRGQSELRYDNRYIMPKVEWDRPLDPNIDQAVLNAVQALSGLGVKFSEQTLVSLVGRNWEEEFNQRVTEARIKQKALEKDPSLAALLGPQGGGAGAPGAGGGGGFMPGLPPEALGFPPGGELGGEPGGGPPAEGAPPPGPGEGGAEVHADADAEGDGHGGGSGEAGDGPGPGWDDDLVDDLADYLKTGRIPDEDVWLRMIDAEPQVALAVAGGDVYAAIVAVESWLIDAGYPAQSIDDLQDALKARLKPRPGTTQKSNGIEDLVEAGQQSAGDTLYTGTLI